MKELIYYYRQPVFFCLCLFLVAGFGYATYQQLMETNKVQKKARQFATAVRRYEMQVEKPPAKGKTKTGPQPDNVLSYLESSMPAKKLADLSPVDSGSGPPRFRIQLSGIKLAPALEVVARLEKDGVVGIKSLTVERIGTFAKKYDIYLQLVKK